MKKYTITLTEEQMRLIANMVEDCTRFLAGQCELWNSTSLLNNGIELREHLNKVVKPMVTPELSSGESYGWNGWNCSNDYQRKTIAMGYGIYRQILHHFAIEYNWQNTYSSPSLTCEEQGGLINIKRLED